MKGKIRQCRDCGEYTLEEQCPHCKGDTRTPHPPRFSPDDKYLRYKIS